MSKEQFAFLDNRQIMEAIGVAQEGLHNIKVRKLKSLVLKTDLIKAYDRVNWIYIRMLLTNIGIGIAFIRWIMGCLYSLSFSLLIKGVASPFFHPERGLRTGLPLSPLLFLLVAKGLSRFLKPSSQSRG